MSYVGNTPTTQGFTPAVDIFSGNGSTTTFTLSRPVASVAQVQAVIENVPQSPTSAFTVSGNTITFTSAPPSGTNNIYVYYTSPITQVSQPGQGTVGNTQMVTGAALANIGAGGLTQSYVGANVAGNGPAFSAYPSVNQALSANTATKITFDVELFDTNNNFASSRFTPTIAGYYQITCAYQFNAASCIAYIYKNGSPVKTTASAGSDVLVTGLIYFNGSTDYVEAYAYTVGGNVTGSFPQWTYFDGALVRAA